MYNTVYSSNQFHNNFIGYMRIFRLSDYDWDEYHVSSIYAHNKYYLSEKVWEAIVY